MSNGRVKYISFMYVAATVAVVVMHANSSFWHYTTDSYWGITNVIESVFYCAVPIFFMLTGATLIDYQKRYSTKTFFKKRFLKTVIPFLAWSIFALFWKSRETIWAMMTGAPNNGLDWTVGSVIKGIFNTQIYSIYWFFIPLFCIYLTIPFYAAIPEKKRIKVYIYAIIASLVFNYSIPFVLGLLNAYTDFSMTSTLTVFISHQYLIYPLIGYVLHKKEMERKYRFIIYGAAIAGLLTFMLGTYFDTRSKGQLVGTFRGYYSLPCVMYSAGMFLFLKNISAKIKSEKVLRILMWFQGYSFPIYLIHRYYLDVFEKYVPLLHWTTASLLYVAGATLLALLLSVLTTWILRKIPILRHMVP